MHFIYLGIYFPICTLSYIVSLFEHVSLLMLYSNLQTVQILNIIPYFPVLSFSIYLPLSFPFSQVLKIVQVLEKALEWQKRLIFNSHCILASIFDPTAALSPYSTVQVNHVSPSVDSLIWQ